MEGKETPVFRRLERADAAQMASVEAACFSLPWTARQCEGALMQDAFAAFGLFARARLMAYISFYHARPEMEIVNLAVLQQWRRRGLGRRILLMALQVARKMGMEKVTLETRQSNAAAIALYESAGFERAGTRRRYYPDTGEDALILQFKFPEQAQGGARAEG